MQHDITHCRNRRCPRHPECYRFKAHEEIQRLKLQGKFSYHLVPPEEVEEVKRGECKMFREL